METPDQDVMGGSHSSSSTGCPASTASAAAAAAAVLKRKRTKRPPPPPQPIAASSSTSSADAVSAATEEEEDMAHCLILLAQGRSLNFSSPPPLVPSPEKFTSRKFTETMTTAGGKAGFYVYECKTCSKCFPSFQALGGHRASHKKPKLSPLTLAGTMTEENIQITDNEYQGNGDGLDVGIINVFSSKPAAAGAPANSPTGCATNKVRVHECSICGAEFSSGQALGGHMRRHRPAGAPPEPQEVKKERNHVLSLDLNLPAPSDENTPIPPAPLAAFSFADKRPMVFSATSALVDCHY